MSGPEPSPKTTNQFKDHYQIGNSLFWSLVKQKRIRLTYITPKKAVVMPEDEQVFVDSCRRSA